jgi:hypothetical protein
VRDEGGHAFVILDDISPLSSKYSPGAWALSCNTCSCKLASRDPNFLTLVHTTMASVWQISNWCIVFCNIVFCARSLQPLPHPPPPPITTHVPACLFQDTWS